jgi:tRNA 2-thiouridine synthesizing protein A
MTGKKTSKTASKSTDKTINMRGLKCPLPALRTKKALGAMTAGELLTIECTDPLTAIDIPNLLRQTGDTLVAKSSAGGVLSFTIRKK